MKHALRKYISSRGSALFMVVSTMSALIVLVTAMYLTVLSTRQVQYTVFNQEQAYVSSTSVAEIIQMAIEQKTEAKPIYDALRDDSFTVGKVLSTKGNGFEAFTGIDTDAKESLFGAYDVNITRLKDESTFRIFDIAVTVVNDGVYETTHTLMSIDMSPSQVGDMNETFAATGYIPNDVWIDSGTYNGSLYFDSEYTRIGDLVGSGGGLTIKCEMRCAGSLVCDMVSSNPVELAEPGVWAIGNNLYIESQPNTYDLGGRSSATSVEPGKIYVGGNLVIKDGTYYQFGGSKTEPTDVYVVGDAYICNINHFYGNLYVGGDVYFVGRGGNACADSGNIYISSDSHIYIDDGDGNYYCETDNYFSEDYDALHWRQYWDNNQLYGVYNIVKDAGGNYSYSAIGADGKYTYGGVRGVGPREIQAFKDSCGTWDKQDAIDYLNAALMQTPFLVWTPDTSDAMTNEIDIHFNLNNGAATNYVYKIDKDCTIDQITAENTGSYQPTIVFDTGKAGNNLVVRLKGNNYSTNKDGKEDCFRWMPEGGGHYAVNVITIGEGNLIIDIPAGVKYQAHFMDFVGHIAWFEHLGGKNGVDSNGCEYFDRSSLDFLTEAGDIGSYILPHIHASTGCSSCVSGLQAVKDASGAVLYYTCPNHGGEYDKDEYDAIKAANKCPCNNRLEYKKSGFPTSTYGGKSQKANVNIYLVSSDESASIHFSGNDVMNNLFFGFVYAPYMTYMDKGDGGGLKNVGGLIVSDYIMRGAYSYVQCYPDLPLKTIIGNDHKGDGSTSNKPWRVYGV